MFIRTKNRIINTERVLDFYILNDGGWKIGLHSGNIAALDCGSYGTETIYAGLSFGNFTTRDEADKVLEKIFSEMSAGETWLDLREYGV